jgi:hypothetical protein
VSLDGVFAGAAVAVVDLDGFVGDIGGRLAGKEFGDGGVPTQKQREKQKGRSDCSERPFRF